MHEVRFVAIVLQPERVAELVGGYILRSQGLSRAVSAQERDGRVGCIEQRRDRVGPSWEPQAIQSAHNAQDFSVRSDDALHSAEVEGRLSGGQGAEERFERRPGAREHQRASGDAERPLRRAQLHAERGPERGGLCEGAPALLGELRPGGEQDDVDDDGIVTWRERGAQRAVVG